MIGGGSLHGLDGDVVERLARPFGRRPHASFSGGAVTDPGRRGRSGKEHQGGSGQRGTVAPLSVDNSQFVITPGISSVVPPVGGSCYRGIYSWHGASRQRKVFILLKRRRDVFVSSLG